MTTEIDHLRAFRADEAAPDPDARAAARIALLGRIAPAAPAPVPARRARRSRPRILVGGLGLAAAAAATIALVTGLESGGVQPATAAQLLRRAAVVAAHEPDVVLKPGQYWYTRSVSRQPEHGSDIQTREEWSAPTGEAHWVVHRPGQPDEEHTLAPSHLIYTFFPRSLTDEQVLALPRDVDALYAAIEHAGANWAVSNGGPVSDRTHEMFTIVGDWLRSSPPLPSSLRAALYRVASRLPDVELLGATRDTQEREGVTVAQTDAFARRELVFDPGTARLLMERIVRPDGGVVYESTYVESGIVGSTHERP